MNATTESNDITNIEVFNVLCIIFYLPITSECESVS
jgi:hypothetical protein